MEKNKNKMNTILLYQKKIDMQGYKVFYPEGINNNKHRFKTNKLHPLIKKRYDTVQSSISNHI